MSAHKNALRSQERKDILDVKVTVESNELEASIETETKTMAWTFPTRKVGSVEQAEVFLAPKR
jgi:hypothetical protein